MWNEIKIIKFLKDKMPFRLRILLIRLLVVFQYIKGMILPRKKLERNGSQNIIFILLSTDYANLGDHAMTYAHERMLKKAFPEYQIIELLVNETMPYLKCLKNMIKTGDIITLKGGGNIGVEYFREELYRRTLLRTFKQNRIVQFPQTVYFPDTALGKREFYKTIKVFNGHKDFKLILRDEVSYELMKQVMDSDKVLLTPDIVLSLKNPINPMTRKYATILMRSDKEGIYGKTDKKLVKDLLEQKFAEVKIADTCTDYVISKYNREEELYKIWTLIGESQLIITDRLHAMVFAALIGTPCIVLNTYNHKLRGVYKWVAHLNYIKVSDLQQEALNACIEGLIKIQVIPYDCQEYSEQFNQIIQSIK